MSQFETLAENIKQDFFRKNNYHFDKKESSLLTLLLIGLLLFLVKLFIIWWITSEIIFQRIKDRHVFIGAAIRTELLFNSDYRMLSRQQKLKLKDVILNHLTNLTYGEFLSLYQEVKNEAS